MNSYFGIPFVLFFLIVTRRPCFIRIISLVIHFVTVDVFSSTGITLREIHLYRVLVESIKVEIPFMIVSTKEKTRIAWLTVHVVLDGLLSGITLVVPFIFGIQKVFQGTDDCLCLSQSVLESLESSL